MDSFSGVGGGVPFVFVFSAEVQYVQLLNY